MRELIFEWDRVKDRKNQQKHGVSFNEATHAFFDPNRIIREDIKHGQEEKRYFCTGLDEEKEGILTVCFTYRINKIRIISAGYWRKGKKDYEKKDQIH